MDVFYEFCAPDCRVWHSADDKWMSLDAAITAVRERGGLPEFTGSRYTLTGTGFVVQTSARLDAAGVTVHIVQIATVEGGRVVQAEEYIGPDDGARGLTAVAPAPSPPHLSRRTHVRNLGPLGDRHRRRQRYRRGGCSAVRRERRPRDDRGRQRGTR